MTKNPKNPLYGKWIVLRHESKVQKTKWLADEIFRPGACLWEFREDYNLLRDGNLERRMRGAEPSIDEFIYDHHDAELKIYESYRDENGNLVGYFDDLYRVARRGRDTLILYTLEYVEAEPDDYRERFVIRKKSCIALLRQFIYCVVSKRK